jgi:predicted dehydrogenase
MLLNFRNGVLATMTASDATPSPWGWEQATGENPLVPATGLGCYRFLGTAGSLEFPSLDVCRHAIDGPGDQRAEIHCEQWPCSQRAALIEQLRHFCELVRGNTAPMVSGEDALETLAGTLAVLKSAKKGEVVFVTLVEFRPQLGGTR